MPKITELPAVAPLTGSEVLPVVQSGLAKSATLDQLVAFISATIFGFATQKSTFDPSIDGIAWFLNGGSPINGVSQIFMNGVLQNTSDFTINLALGQVLAPAFTQVGVSNRIDIFWF
jgi:hypothetical protein